MSIVSMKRKNTHITEPHGKKPENTIIFCQTSIINYAFKP